MPPNPYLKALGEHGKVASADTTRTTSKASRKKLNPRKAVATPEATNPQGDGFKNEILALGGDAEDFEMLQDLETESEYEEGDEDGSERKPPAKGLLSDLRSFVKGLDFKAAGADNPDLDSADDEADDLALEETVAEDKLSKVKSSKVENGPSPSAVASEQPKESKAEREKRRRAEREIEKEAERIAKVQERAVRDEKVKTVPSKSPWTVEPTPQWYATPLPPSAPSALRPSPATISSLLSRAQDLLAKDNALYASSLDPKASRGSAPPPPTGLSKADQVFVQQILTSGTSSDRVSALLLLVSSSPLHTMSYLDQLASLARKKSRDESGRALRGVVDWWRGEGGGSPIRKLRAFADQPLLPTVALAYEAFETRGKSASSATIHRDEMEACLTLFAFEDWLKKWFFQILQALEQMSVDPLAHPRTLAVLHLSNLLRDKPEQESNILRLLVNKLGDTQRGIASKTSHHLLQVLQTHPGMTPILVREVASLVLRPRSTAASGSASGSHVRFGGDAKASKGPSPDTPDQGRDNARYYGIITLNQVMLAKDQGDVAGKMIDVYFEVFGDVLGRLPEKEEGESADEGEDPEKEKKEKGQKRKRGDNSAKGAVQAAPAGVGEMDSKLVAAVLTGINRAFPFATIDDDAFKQRLDTLFRITHTGTFNVSIQALLLIYHVSAAKRAISDRFYRALYASLFDPRLVSSSKQALYLNLVFRATKHDPDPKRVMAVVKRLIQILSTMDVTFTLGALYVVGELMSSVPGLREMIAESELAKKSQGVPELKPVEGEKKWPTSYDGKKREPEYANAQNSCLWELTPLLTHWHPTVALYVDALLSFSPLPVSDDLEQHSLNTFLDRFIYREPKKSVSSKGSSMMQSGLAGQDRSGRVVLVKGSSAKKGEVAVNSDKFRRKNAYDVPADQLFFHKYFTSRTTAESEKLKATSKRKSRRGGDDLSSDSEESIADAGIAETGEDFDQDALAAAMEEEIGEESQGEEEEGSDDDEMEEEIWNAMRKSMPREAGDPDMADEDDPEAAADEDEEDLAAYDYSDSDDEEEATADEAPYKSPFADEEDDGGDDDDAFLEEDGDLLDSDADIPLYGSDDEPEAKKIETSNPSKNKKRKLKHLPLFATADDYAKLLGGSDDEDI